MRGIAGVYGVCRLLRAGAAALVALCSSASAAKFYVATDGKDENPGTLEAPFASIGRAQEAVSPGDSVIIRGGTYRMREADIVDRRRGRARVFRLDKSGREEKPIEYAAAEGEEPIFDFTDVKPARLRVTAFEVNGSWIRLKGLTVVGVQVTILGHTQSICFDNEGDHNVYERLTMRDGQAIGFWLGRGSQNLILNCDAYRNHDYTSEDKRGGNVDGFGFHVPKGSVGNVFRGCRAWFNSDDGFDFIMAAEPVTVENCWAFYNGFDSKFKSLADGNGFKAGGYARTPPEELPKVIPRHVVRSSVAVRNKASGFYSNHHPGGVDFINDTAFRNSINFNLLGRNLKDVNDVPGFGHRLKNNLGYQGKKEVANFDASTCEFVNNYFDLKLQLKDSDFAGLDETDLMKPRQKNGDLPDVPFLRPVKGSQFLNRGADVGLPFKGIAPELGAFEFKE